MALNETPLLIDTATSPEKATAAEQLLLSLQRGENRGDFYNTSITAVGDQFAVVTKLPGEVGSVRTGTIEVSEGGEATYVARPRYDIDRDAARLHSSMSVLFLGGLDSAA